MGKRITVDPITRIEGHLRIEVEVEGGKVVNAWSSGQMFRGIEMILQGRDPRDATPFSFSAHAVSAPMYTRFPQSAPLTMRWASPFPPMPALSAICCTAPSTSMITSFISIICMPWTGVDIVSALSADPQKTATLGRQRQRSPMGRNSLLPRGPKPPKGVRGKRPAGSPLRMPIGGIRPTNCRRKPT